MTHIPSLDETSIHLRYQNDKVYDWINNVATLAIDCFWTPEGNVHSKFGSNKFYHFENTSKAYQLLYTTTNVVLAALGIIPAVLGNCLTAIANMLKSKQFNYLYTGAPAAQQVKKILHANVCMLPGGLPSSFGSMSPAKERVDNLVQFIKSQNAEIIAFSEVSRTISSLLFNRLKDEYKLFFTDIGLKPFGMEAGLFIASKVPVKEASFNIFKASDKGGQKMYKRGYFTFETKDHYFIYTHLSPNSKQVRTDQLKEIQNVIESLKNKSVILFGDLNVEKKTPDTSDYQALTQLGLHDPGDTTFTCTENGKEECIDYFLIQQNNVHITLHSVAFSDHKALTVDFKQKLN